MTFCYRGRDLNTNALVNGFITAENGAAAIAQLKNKGMRVITLAPRKTGVRLTRAAKEARLSFFRGYAALAASGMPNEQILAFLVRTQPSAKSGAIRLLSQALVKLRAEITSGGLSLAQAMHTCPELFSATDAGIAQAALDTSGNIAHAFERHARTLASEINFESELSAKLRQPIITIVIVALAVPMILANLMPTLDLLARQTKQDESAFFAAFLTLGRWARSPVFWLVYLAAPVAAFFALRAGAVKRRLRAMPIAGKLARAQAMEVSARTLGQAYAGGKSPATACSFAARTIEDEELAQAFGRAADDLVHGRAKTLAEALERQGDVFDPLFIAYMAMAREDRVPEMADYASENARRIINDLMETIPGYVTIASTLAIGVVVGAIAVFVYSATSSAMVKINEPHYTALGG